MPSETVHTPPHESDVAPAEERVRKFGEPTGERGTVWTSDQYQKEHGGPQRFGKYGVGDGAGGAQFDNQNNYFFQGTQDEDAISTVIENTRKLADEQPRRVRHENGKTERLVKYADGNFDWIPTGETQAQTSAEVPLGVLEEVTSGIDNLEAANKERDEEMSELKAQIEAQKAQIEELTRKLEELATDKKNDDEQNFAGKEVELYNPTSKEVELYDDPELEEELESAEFEATISEEMLEALNEAQDTYAKLTAKNRDSYLGHFLHTSTHLAKIEFIKKRADKFNAKHDAKITEAREEYEQAVHAIQEEIMNQNIEFYGDDPGALKQVRMKAGDFAIQSETKLEFSIASERMQASGKTNAFINWWVKQEGFLGKAKKAGLIAGAGLTVGVAAGLAGIPFAGVGVGAGLGAGIGAYVTKKRAAGIVKKEGAVTVSEQQGVDDFDRKRAYANQQHDAGEVVDIADLTKITEERTAMEKARNRARLKGAVGAGLAGGAAGAHLGGAIREGITNMVSNVSAADTPPSTEATPPSTGGAEQAASQPPTLQGNEFTVDSGSSYTNELMQFAEANGHALSPDQSFQLHQELVNQFGPDYIDINGAGGDIYTEGADIRLTEPGAAKWADGVGQFVQQWMANHGV